MKITTMTLKELACQYLPMSTPRSATAQLKRWMNRNVKLMQALDETGYIVGQRFLTPKQVTLVFECLGEP